MTISTLKIFKGIHLNMKMNVFSPEQALCKFYSLVSKTIFEIGHGKKKQYPLLTEEISLDLGKKIRWHTSFGSRHKENRKQVKRKHTFPQLYLKKKKRIWRTNKTTVPHILFSSQGSLRKGKTENSRSSIPKEILLQGLQMNAFFTRLILVMGIKWEIIY